MNVTFPFGLPNSATIYLILLLVTLTVHLVLMSYVLAGALWLVFGRVRRSAAEPPIAPAADAFSIGDTLRDWLPFALGAAITAGVAPLLFIQVLYKRNFYSANLLLFNRWMAIVPVLIVAFYLLYLNKTSGIARWPAVIQRAIRFLTFVGFLFVAFSWTENHLLGLQPQVWPSQYESRSLMFRDSVIVPRLGVWVFGALPIMATVVIWQARRAAKRGMKVSARSIRLLAGIAMGGLLAMMACFVSYALLLDAASAEALISAFGLPYVVVAALGIVGQFACWRRLWRLGCICSRSLAWASAAVVATVFSLCAVREVVRIATLADEGIFAQLTSVAASGGLMAFLCFFVVNAALIAYCLWLVTKRLPATPA